MRQSDRLIPGNVEPRAADEPVSAHHNVQVAFREVIALKR
jgi:hypothetical protein